jgi:hypothetical protein
MAKRSCPHSGAVYDDLFRPWKYPDGLPVIECETCGAKRKLELRSYTLARGAITETKAIYPYHQRPSR